MNIKFTAFWIVTPYTSTNRYRYFTGTHCLHLPSSLNMEAAGFSKTLVPAHRTTWWHILEDRNLIYLPLQHGKDRPDCTNNRTLLHFLRKGCMILTNYSLPMPLLLYLILSTVSRCDQDVALPYKCTKVRTASCLHSVCLSVRPPKYLHNKGQLFIFCHNDRQTIFLYI